MKKIIIWVVSLVVICIGTFIGGICCLAVCGTQALSQLRFDEEQFASMTDEVEAVVDSVIDFVEKYEGEGTFNIEFDTWNKDLSGEVGKTNVVTSTDIISDSDISSIYVKDTIYNVELVDSASNELVVTFDGKVPVEYLSDSDLLTVAASGGGVMISVKQPTFITDSAISGTITIAVPTAYTGSMSAEATVGNLSCNCSALFEKFTLDATVGKADIRKLNASSLVIDSVLGKVEAEGAFKQVIIKSCLANIEVSSNCHIENMSEISDNLGKVELDLPDNGSIQLRQSDNLGQVDFDGISDANGVLLEVSDNLGKVEIDN